MHRYPTMTLAVLLLAAILSLAGALPVAAETPETSYALAIRGDARPER